MVRLPCNFMADVKVSQIAILGGSALGGTIGHYDHSVTGPQLIWPGDTMVDILGQIYKS